MQTKLDWRNSLVKSCASIALAFFALVAFSGAASAQTSTSSFNNAALTTQTGQFQVTFDAVPNGASVNAVIGLSNGPATAYTGLAVAVRFNEQGAVDARNGSIYAATKSVPYISGKSYRFRLLIDITTHRYDVFVTPSGVSSETQLAQGFGFRSEQAAVTQLNNRAMISEVGSETLSNFFLQSLSTRTPTTTTETSSTAWKNAAFTSQTGRFEVKFNAIPNGANINAVTGLSNGAATAFTNLAVSVRFADTGKIEARNGSSYASALTLPYISGKSYAFRLVVDVAAKKYDVYVTPAGASESTIALGYAFRTEQSSVTQLNNRAMTAVTGTHTISGFSVAALSTPTATPVPPASGTPIPSPTGGISALYPNDIGIEKDPDVIFMERFDVANFYTRWGYSTIPTTWGWTAGITSSDPLHGFSPLSNAAYRITMKQGANVGTAIELKTQQIIGTQPDELYFRYMLMLGSNFRDVSDGGKMPGLAGDTSICGNGGRKCDGTTGWSLRGSFLCTTKSEAMYPKVLLGTYAYHADMAGTYGDQWRWNKNNLGYVDLNKWYSVEQYVKMNTPGKRDGILKVWINGQLAFEKYDVNLRVVSSLHIYKAWIDIYFGGGGKADHDMDLYIDNMVIAKKYIGPMLRQ